MQQTRKVWRGERRSGGNIDIGRVTGGDHDSAVIEMKSIGHWAFKRWNMTVFEWSVECV